MSLFRKAEDSHFSTIGRYLGFKQAATEKCEGCGEMRILNKDGLCHQCEVDGPGAGKEASEKKAEGIPAEPMSNMPPVDSMPTETASDQCDESCSLFGKEHEEMMKKYGPDKANQMEVESSVPKEWENTTKHMKKHKEITNPFALTNWMANKGYTPHK